MQARPTKLIGLPPRSLQPDDMLSVFLRAATTLSFGLALFFLILACESPDQGGQTPPEAERSGEERETDPARGNGADEDAGKRGACRATGCSGQICADHDVVTTCEFRQEYACFRCMKCTRVDGACQWKRGPDWERCTADKPFCQSGLEADLGR